jgi:peptidoglycan/xylan/chitin deacetylase (PgdA/CDA1 family)
MPRAASILLYHGVTTSPSQGVANFSGKHIAADAFECQMRWLADHANPMTLRMMAKKLADGQELPERSVAVTFDDAFKNVHDVALPILKRHGIPATFFISTGFVGRKRNIWADSVEHAVNMSASASISLCLRGEEHSFSLADDASKIAAIIAIKTVMKKMPPTERYETLALLCKAAGPLNDPADCPNYQNLDWDDVRRLDAPADYEVGGHSVNHEMLSYLDEETLAQEIVGCLQSLANELGHRVDLFSYPEGQAEHYNDRVIDKLKDQGVVVCPSAIDGVNYPGCDPFHLRRQMVGFMGAPFPFAM